MLTIRVLTSFDVADPEEFFLPTGSPIFQFDVSLKSRLQDEDGIKIPPSS